MSAEEILITHNGYTHTAWSTCGNSHCTNAVLFSLGFTRTFLEDNGNELRDEPLSRGTTVTTALLGETDCDEWCCACGEFIRHGLECECEDTETDREYMDGPRIEFRDSLRFHAYMHEDTAVLDTIDPRT